MGFMNINAEQFSAHLFWDVDSTKLDLEERYTWFIVRVLQFGLIHDWKLILEIYGIDKITEVAKKSRDIDRRTASFIATLSNEPKETFLCYTSHPSTKTFWNL